MTQPFAIAIHGGAGTILREQMSESLRTDILNTLEQAVRAGHQLLTQGADALDAVVAAVTVLEDSPLFNAGKGSVLTHNEMVEMDASVMHGAMREVGDSRACATLKTRFNSRAMCCVIVSMFF